MLKSQLEEYFSLIIIRIKSPYQLVSNSSNRGDLCDTGQSLRCERREFKSNFKDVKRLKENEGVKNSQQLCSNDNAFFYCYGRGEKEDRAQYWSERSEEALRI